MEEEQRVLEETAEKRKKNGLYINWIKETKILYNFVK